jgi:hypothetical protein
MLLEECPRFFFDQTIEDRLQQARDDLLPVGHHNFMIERDYRFQIVDIPVDIIVG